jgi:hypothetical protein
MKTKPLSKKRVLNIIAKGRETHTIDFTEVGANAHTLKILRDCLLEEPTEFSILEMYGNNALGDEKGMYALHDMVDRVHGFHTLKLEFNSMNSTTMLLLCDWLKKNKTITVLDLYGNTNIGDEGAIHLADLIRHGTRLQYLGLFACGITDVGCKQIIKALTQNRGSLKQINLFSNDIEQEYVDYVDAILTKKPTEFKIELEEKPVSQVPRYAQSQRTPRIDPIFKSTDVVSYAQERKLLLERIERLKLVQQQQLIQLNKESDIKFGDTPTAGVSAPLPSPVKRTWNQIYQERTKTSPDQTTPVQETIDEPIEIQEEKIDNMPVGATPSPWKRIYTEHVH